MYNYYDNNYSMNRSNIDENNMMYTVDDRGFLVPFVLGGITGGLLAPAFYRPYYNAPCYGSYCNRPNYYPPYYY